MGAPLHRTICRMYLHLHGLQMKMGIQKLLYQFTKRKIKRTVVLLWDITALLLNALLSKLISLSLSHTHTHARTHARSIIHYSHRVWGSNTIIQAD
jgi:hypothetical protein